MRRTPGTIATTGVGKPDYSREVSSGRVRPGLEVKYNQTLLPFLVGFSAIPSPIFPWMQAPLAPGATAHYIDGTTGLALPYNVLQGYTITAISSGVVCTQDVEIWMYIAGFRHLCTAVVAGGTPYYVPEVVGFTSAQWDPTGATPFPFDLQITNNGGADLEGTMGVYMILEAVSTAPFPMVKTVKCKGCDATKQVPIETTEVICDNCGQLTRYYRLVPPKGGK